MAPTRRGATRASNLPAATCRPSPRAWRGATPRRGEALVHRTDRHCDELHSRVAVHLPVRDEERTGPGIEEHTRKARQRLGRLAFAAPPAVLQADRITQSASSLRPQSRCRRDGRCPAVWPSAAGASLNNLAFLYKSQGRYAEAEPLYEHR